MDNKLIYNTKIYEEVKGIYMILAKKYQLNLDPQPTLIDYQQFYGEIIDKTSSKKILSNIREINKLLYKNKNQRYMFDSNEYNLVRSYIKSVEGSIQEVEEVKTEKKESKRLEFKEFSNDVSIEELKFIYKVNSQELFRFVIEKEGLGPLYTFDINDVLTILRKLSFKNKISNLNFDNYYNIISNLKYLGNIKEKNVIIGYLKELKLTMKKTENGQNISMANEKSSNNLKEVLTYLSDTSKEAIVNSSEFNDFKKYLHVSRQIEEVFEKTMTNNLQTKEKSLTLMCGNVGDGKSHLLAYMKEEKPALFRKVYVHNDATESLLPELTAIETLERVLSEFTDENIDNPDSHVVLAINVGVLNNFVQEMKTKNKFSQLIDFIETSGIFERSNYRRYKKGPFRIISFLDYSSFEITKDGTTSYFYDELFRKIFSKTESNPFYTAYLKDKKEYKEDQLNYNYELLLNPRIQESIKYLLIRVQIEYKEIISTRALLNFLYDVIVPGEDVQGKVEGYLPYLVFDNQSKSPILSALSKLDPLNFQNDQIDQLNVELYNTDNYLDKVENLLSTENYKLLEPVFISINGKNTKNHKRDMSVFVRTKFLLNHRDLAFNQITYFEYLKFLSESKSGEKMKQLAALIRDAVFKWNGSPKKNYLFLSNERVNDLSFAVKIKLGFQQIIETTDTSYTILMEFTNQGEKYTLDLDFQLFSLLLAVESGYFLKESDKKQGVNFSEFIEKIINETKALDSTMVLDHTTNELFEFSYGIEFEVEKVY